jgi:hypothetical protein
MKCIQPMNSIQRLILIAVLLAPLLPAADGPTGFPFQNETLRYSINWPSGLSLGEATMIAHRSESGWNFDVEFNAGIPAFPFADKYKASASPDFCSVELRRDISHGSRKVSEKTTFDQKKNQAQRQTVVPAGGGKTEFSIPTCAKDAIAFQYLARRELGQGRVPPAEKVFFGSGYSVKMDYTGAQTITAAEKPTVTDHLNVSVKGPASDFTFEIFYARDAARTPLLIKIPVTVGTISLELVR